MSVKNEFNQEIGFHVKNWTFARMPQQMNLTGQYGVLQPLDPKVHAENLYTALSLDNPGDSWTYLPYGPFSSADEFKEWLKWVKANKINFLYVICDVNDQKPIGMTSYVRLNFIHGVVEIGHVHLSKLLKKTTLATEAMYLILRYAFEELSFRRCEWKCDTMNRASYNAALRFGFKLEGVFRQSHVVRGHNRDTAWFSMIDSEWPEVKIKFEKWLHPSNFDEQGQQIVRLSEVSI